MRFYLACCFSGVFTSSGAASFSVVKVMVSCSGPRGLDCGDWVVEIGVVNCRPELRELLGDASVELDVFVVE